MSQLSLALHFPCNINRVLHCLPRLLPQLIRCLLCFFTPFLDLWVRPLEVKCQVKICLMIALRDGIVDEGACIEVAEVDLRQRKAVSFSA